MLRSVLALIVASVALLIARGASAAYAHRFTWKTTPDPQAVARCANEMRRFVPKRADAVDVVEGTAPDPVLRLRSKFDGRELAWPGVVDAPNVVDTDRLPWDEVVTATLLVARDCFPKDVLAIESDGDWLAWQDGRILYQEVFGKPPRNPGVRDHAGFHAAGRAFVPAGDPRQDRFKDPRTRPWAIVIVLCLVGLVVLLVVPTKRDPDE